MRHSARRQLLAIIAVLLANGTAIGCERNPSASLICRVSVTGERAVASFPLVEPPFVWRWSLDTTPDNGLEYRWIAEFGNCSDRGEFEIGDYAFDVQLYKLAGRREQTGMITDLLRYAQKDFVRRSQVANRVEYSRIDGASVGGNYKDGLILVDVQGKPVDQLLRGRPKYALLTVNVPDPKQSYTCITKVEYK